MSTVNNLMIYQRYQLYNHFGFAVPFAPLYNIRNINYVFI